MRTLGSTTARVFERGWTTASRSEAVGPEPGPGEIEHLDDWRVLTWRAKLDFLGWPRAEARSAEQS